MNSTHKRITTSRSLETSFARSTSAIVLLLCGAAAVAPIHAQQYEISTYVGGLPALRSPVVAVETSLGAPSAVAADPAGNVYFTVRDLNSVFKLDRNGLLTRVAGSSTAGFSGDGGPATSARLRLAFQGDGWPAVMADAGGNLFIADVGNHRIRRVSSDGIIDTVAGNGTSGFSGDSGPATSASLQWPGGVALDSESNLLIADRGNHRVRKVSASGIITTVAGTGMVGFSGDGGPASAAQLNAPAGVAIDRAGNLFIAESGNARIRKVSSNGTITTMASNAGLRYPTAVAVNGAGDLFIADPQCSCIRKLSPDGIITLVAGGSFGFSGDGGPATSARLWDPWGVAVDGTGNVFIADGGNTRIRKVSPSGIITTVAGDGGFDSLFSFSGDGGPAIQAELKLAVPLAPSSGVAVDGAGNLFIADTGNHSVRKISLDGIITTIAGIGRRRCSGAECLPLGDGGPATRAALSYPTGVAIDSNGNVFIADYGNVRVRKVSSDGIITTVAGNGTLGYSGNGGLATDAALNAMGVAVDWSGNLFITDGDSVRKVSSDGIITVVAGGGRCDESVCSLGDDGPAVGARLGATNVAVDEAGNLFIADNQGTDFSCDFRVRKVSPNGIITTVAGITACSGISISGDGGPAASAQLSFTPSVTSDKAGNVFIADIYNHRIRRITRDGIIDTVAGGAYGFSGDGGSALQAALSYPIAVAADATGNVYVADAGNNAIRVLRPKTDSASIGTTK